VAEKYGSGLNPVRSAKNVVLFLSSAHRSVRRSCQTIARERLPRVAVPDDDRLALVGDSDDVGLHPARGNRLARGRERALENLFGVVLDPAGLRVVLRYFLVTATGYPAVGCHHQSCCAGRSLVYREDVLRGCCVHAANWEDRGVL
jgi:hypothetical protein